MPFADQDIPPNQGHAVAENFRKPSGPPTAALHVLAADADSAVQQFYRTALPRLGHQVCIAGAGPHLVEQYRALHPDLVILAAQLPGLDGVSAAAEICRDRPVPVILVAAVHDPELLERAAAHPCILACLVKPIREADLLAAIMLARSGFARTAALQREAAELRRTLEDRKLIERAKGIVMRRLAVDEKEAFDRLRRHASDRNRKLVEVAQTVLGAEAIFEALEPAAHPPRESPANGRHRPVRNGYTPAAILHAPSVDGVAKAAGHGMDPQINQGGRP